MPSKGADIALHFIIANCHARFHGTVHKIDRVDSRSIAPNEAGLERLRPGFQRDIGKGHRIVRLSLIASARAVVHHIVLNQPIAGNFTAVYVQIAHHGISNISQQRLSALRNCQRVPVSVDHTAEWQYIFSLTGAGRSLAQNADGLPVCRQCNIRREDIAAANGTVSGGHIIKQRFQILRGTDGCCFRDFRIIGMIPWSIAEVLKGNIIQTQDCLRLAFFPFFAFLFQQKKFGLCLIDNLFLFQQQLHFSSRFGDRFLCSFR